MTMGMFSVVVVERSRSHDLGNSYRRTEMSAIVKQQDESTAVTDYSGGLLEVIARAARDPNVDIDKMERLLAMQERVQARQAEIAFNEAMTAAQSEMRPISTDASNPQTRSRYATFAKLDKALRPIYTNHGFSLSFDEGDAPRPDYVRVLCHVAHVAGHSRTYRRDMPADGKGAKGGDVMTKTHAAGAAGSYGARYLLKGIFNVAIGEDDTDGNVPIPSINQEQMSILNGLAEVVGADKIAFCRYLKVGSIKDIPGNRYIEAVNLLSQKNPDAARQYMTGGQ
jgi:hypothetical protein